MKLFFLTRKIESEIDYDENESFVIRAVNSKAARILANLTPGDEGPIWTDANKTDCVPLTNKGKECVIVRNYNAG